MKNIDDVLKYHQDFLDQCLKNCMLTTPELLKPIINLCNICIKFCDFLAVSTGPLRHSARALVGIVIKLEMEKDCCLFDLVVFVQKDPSLEHSSKRISPL